MSKLVAASGIGVILLVVFMILAQLGLMIFLIWQMVAALVAAEYLKAAAFGGALLVLALIGRARRDN